MNIVFFSSSDFTLPIIKDILKNQDNSIIDVFNAQYNKFLTNIEIYKRLGLVMPNNFDSVLEMIKIIKNTKIKLIGIVSNYEKENRGKIILNPVLEFARSKNINTFSPKKLNSNLDFLKNEFMKNCDISILASYGQMISNDILNIPKLGFINWHPSLLPKYRGASPMQQVLINGDDISGLTWLEMVKKMDAGDIWFQIPYTVGREIDLDELISVNVKLGVETWTFPIICKLLDI